MCALTLANSNSEDAQAVGDMARELKPAKELTIPTVGLLTDKARETGLREVADYVISNIRLLHSIVHE